MNALFELTQVTRRYGDRLSLHVDELRILPGEVVGLAGPNGSGKSTLLRLLALIEPPSSGSIRYDGRPVRDPAPLRREITLLQQDPYLLKRTVYANVAYGLHVRGADDVPDRVRRALRMAGLDADIFANRSWRELSGGEARRVALAARLVLEPRVLLLDEPTTSLDEESLELMQRAIEATQQALSTTLVVASHDQTWLRGLAERTLTLRQGRITG